MKKALTPNDLEEYCKVINTTPAFIEELGNYEKQAVLTYATDKIRLRDKSMLNEVVRANPDYPYPEEYKNRHFDYWKSLRRPDQYDIVFQLLNLKETPSAGSGNVPAPQTQENEKKTTPKPKTFACFLKKEAQKHAPKIAAYLLKDYPNVKGKELAALCFGLYSAGLMCNPCSVDGTQQELFNSLRNILSGKNGSRQAFGLGLTHFNSLIKEAPEVTTWRKRFLELLKKLHLSEEM